GGGAGSWGAPRHQVFPRVVYARCPVSIGLTSTRKDAVRHIGLHVAYCVRVPAAAHPAIRLRVWTHRSKLVVCALMLGRREPTPRDGPPMVSKCRFVRH